MRAAPTGGIATERCLERRLKAKKSHRTIPLWRQLREALEQYLAERPPTRLLFPS